MKMEQTECSETSAYKIQTPGNYPEENIQYNETCSTSPQCDHVEVVDQGRNTLSKAKSPYSHEVSVKSPAMPSVRTNGGME